MKIVKTMHNDVKIVNSSKMRSFDNTERLLHNKELSDCQVHWGRELWSEAGARRAGHIRNQPGCGHHRRGER